MPNQGTCFLDLLRKLDPVITPQKLNFEFVGSVHGKNLKIQDFAISGQDIVASILGRVGSILKDMS
jgi:hypothetical protein